MIIGSRDGDFCGLNDAGSIGQKSHNCEIFGNPFLGGSIFKRDGIAQVQRTSGLNSHIVSVNAIDTCAENIIVDIVVNATFVDVFLTGDYA